MGSQFQKQVSWSEICSVTMSGSGGAALGGAGIGRFTSMEAILFSEKREQDEGGEQEENDVDQRDDLDARLLLAFFGFGTGTSHVEVELAEMEKGRRADGVPAGLPTCPAA